jgi:hypothetical protein
MPETDADPEWAELRERIDRELSVLRVSEFIVITGPPLPSRALADWRQNTGLLQRILGRPNVRPEEQDRFVQFARDEAGFVYGECSRATFFGGNIEISRSSRQRLCELGWLAPGDSGYVDFAFGKGATTYRIGLNIDDPAALTDLTIKTLQALGVGPMDAMETERGEY